MKNDNGTNKKLYQILLLAAIPFILIIFVMNSNKTVSSQGGDPSNPNVKVDPVISQALTYYYDKVGNENSDGIEAVKKNFGCHFEIFIYNNGELDMRLAYSGGRFYEL